MEILNVAQKSLRCFSTTAWQQWVKNGRSWSSTRVGARRRIRLTSPVWAERCRPRWDPGSVCSGSSLAWTARWLSPCEHPAAPCRLQAAWTCRTRHMYTYAIVIQWLCYRRNWSGDAFLTDLSRQCAAVRTHSGWTSVAPQKWIPELVERNSEWISVGQKRGIYDFFDSF